MRKVRKLWLSCEWKEKHVDVNISYVSDRGVIQLRLCVSLKLVTAITRGKKCTHAEYRTGAILAEEQRMIH